MKAYSTHGNWSTLERIGELEKGRGNSFPDPPYPLETPAIWVCLFPGDCLYYEPEIMLEDLTEIVIAKHHVLCNYDFNGGFLLLEPQVKLST